MSRILKRRSNKSSVIEIKELLHLKFGGERLFKMKRVNSDQINRIEASIIPSSDGEEMNLLVKQWEEGKEGTTVKSYSGSSLNCKKEALRVQTELENIGYQRERE